jgi:hypothetical protein
MAAAFMEQENSKSPKTLPEIFIAEFCRISTVHHTEFFYEVR